MEEKVYNVLVEKMNRIQIFSFFLMLILISYGISEYFFHLGIEISESAILFLLIVILCFLENKYGYFSPEDMNVVFQKEQVVFQRGNKKKEICYEDINEVEKIMVINRYHGEKGYYRIKIKMKKGSYAIYSGEDSGKQLDFSQTGISKVYFEFQSRGIKCC